MNDPGTIYLLHFERPLAHARHYLGWTGNLEQRLARHASGQGARLMRAARDAGIRWRLARTWEGSRHRERQLKRQGGLSRRCPICGVTPGTAAERNALAQLASQYPDFTVGG